MVVDSLVMEVVEQQVSGLLVVMLANCVFVGSCKTGD